MQRICVLMATYNGEKYIEEQILSIRNQKEVICDLYAWDDGSTDKTISILKKNNVKILGCSSRFGKPCYVFFSLVLKIKKKYDYYAFSDQDDIWLQNKIYEGLNTIKEENLDLYSSNLISYNFKDKVSLVNKSTNETRNDFLFQGLSAGNTYIFTYNLFNLLRASIKKESITNLEFSHDWFLYALARHNKLRAFCDQRSFIIYRQHSTNVSSSNTSINFIAKKIYYFLCLEHKKERARIHKLLCFNESKWFIFKNIFTLKRNKLYSIIYGVLLILGF
jgi:rhamnosyltransferase